MASGMKGKSENDMISRGRLMRRLLYLLIMQGTEGMSQLAIMQGSRKAWSGYLVLTGCCAPCACQL